MKAYIATTLKNKAKHNEVRDALKQEGIELTYDWTILGDVRHHGKEILRTVSVEETKGIVDAEIVIVILPGGKGTHVELGMAIAKRKPVLFYLPTIDTQRVLVEPELTCAFYHNPLVIPVYTIRDILNRVRAVKRKLEKVK